MYGDAGEFDWHCGIKLENLNQWLYMEGTISSFLGSDNGTLSYGDSCNKIS